MVMMIEVPTDALGIVKVARVLVQRIVLMVQIVAGVLDSRRPHGRIAIVMMMMMVLFVWWELWFNCCAHWALNMMWVTHQE